MILRTTQGKSFKGLGQYVLNDKGTTATADRVAFAETINTASDRAHVALAEMIEIATHQAEIKRANGKRGTKNSNPVYHLSMSWEVNEQPTKADQIEAAREALSCLGLQDHQTLIVAHTDTENPHVHAVVNLVHPETGDTAKIGNDRLKLSEWALEYRRARGQEHLCPNRPKNIEARKKQWAKDQSLTRQEWMAWKRAQTDAVWAEYRQDRDNARADRKGMYEALWRQKEERFALRRDEIKYLYKPIWRDVFKRQRDELREFDAGFVGRIRVAMRHGNLGGVAQAVFNGSTMRGELIRYHETERKDLAGKQKARIRDASREVTKAWKYDRDQLKALHKDQDKERLERARGDSDKIWKDRTRPTPEQTAEIKRTTPQPETGQEFEEKRDRRRPENKINRSTLDAFYGDDKEKLEKVRTRRKNRVARKQRERSRPRDRNRDFDMD